MVAEAEAQNAIGDRYDEIEAPMEHGTRDEEEKYFVSQCDLLNTEIKWEKLLPHYSKARLNEWTNHGRSEEEESEAMISKAICRRQPRSQPRGRKQKGGGRRKCASSYAETRVAQGRRGGSVRTHRSSFLRTCGGGVRIKAPPLVCNSR